jgi:hypothetical protein
MRGLATPETAHAVELMLADLIDDGRVPEEIVMGHAAYREAFGHTAVLLMGTAFGYVPVRLDKELMTDQIVITTTAKEAK